jgi:hypothetical protein
VQSKIDSPGKDYRINALDGVAFRPFEPAALTRHYPKAGRMKEIKIIDAERREFRPLFLSLFQVTKRNTS